MIDHLIESNGLMPQLAARGLDAKDLVFIKEQIYGPLPDSNGERHGRPLHKAFLYEIVANKRNGKPKMFLPVIHDCAMTVGKLLTCYVTFVGLCRVSVVNCCFVSTLELLEGGSPDT